MVAAMTASTLDPMAHARPADSGIRIAVLVQGLAVTLALLAAMLAPPDEGPMMVIPLGGDGMGRTLDWASGDGAAFLGAGPLPGSILVYGRREQLMGGAWHHHSLLVKAPAIFCGRISTPSKNG
jgi:hypothetical protein